MAATLQAPAEPTKPRETPAGPQPANSGAACRGEARLDSGEPVLLEGVTWAFYLAARDQFADAFHIAFDRGRMEIMPPPSLGHDRPKIAVSRLLDVYLIGRGIAFDGIGSTTLQREDLLKGNEPDEAYYIGEPRLPPGARDLDLAIHPPPNLVIEVDRTSSSIPREPIFAALGVEELWRWDVESDALRIRRLRDDRGGYDDSSKSVLLPDLPADGLAEHVRLGDRLRQSEVLRRWRDALQ